MNKKVKIILIVILVIALLFIVYRFVLKQKDKKEISELKSNEETIRIQTPVDIALADVPESGKKLVPPLPAPNGYEFLGETKNPDGEEMYQYKKISGFGIIYRPKYV